MPNTNEQRPVPDIEVVSRREQRGEKIGGRGKVIIIRTVDAQVDRFNPMDYTYIISGLKKTDIKKAVNDFNGEETPRTPIQRTLYNVICHMQTCAIYEEKPQHVITGIAKSSDVYAATNPGEFFYDGEGCEGKIQISCDKHGNVEIVKPIIESKKTFTNGM